jgi:hypothetical protein
MGLLAARVAQGRARTGVLQGLFLATVLVVLGALFT